jgi:hypothetical protein
MNFKELTVWVEAHPGESILIGGGGLIFILWLLGYFSSSSSGPAQDPLAAAYYAAEANQAVVAGQIQNTTLTTARDTAVAGIQANAAVAINAAQTGAATVINGQNTGAATTINSQTVSAEQATLLGVSSNQLQATYSNNASALAAVQSNNATATTINATNNQTNLMGDYINKIIAPEMLSPAGQATGGNLGFATPWGNFNQAGGSLSPNIAALMSMGYTSDQALHLAGF